MTVGPDRTAGRVMFSASEDGFAAATHELREVFGRGLQIERAGPDLGLLPPGSPGVAQVHAACLGHPVAFVRHLSVARRIVPRQQADDLDRVATLAAEVVASAPDDLPDGAELAVQAWSSGTPRLAHSAGQLALGVSERLLDKGFGVTRAGSAQVLSCCLTSDGVVVGLNRRALSLSDWPGGRVRLGRPPGQVSRSEFKLEELFQLCPLEIPAAGTALDLGAAPGGWTRILRQRGLEVWAVDPGELAPPLPADPLVHHQAATAGEFLRRTGIDFDLVVNDMRMDPELSSEVMLQAAQRLRPGGVAIITLKTGTHRPVRTLHRCLRILQPKYETVFARQLHHNRHELTVVAQRRG